MTYMKETVRARHSQDRDAGDGAHAEGAVGVIHPIEGHEYGDDGEGGDAAVHAQDDLQVRVREGSGGRGQASVGVLYRSRGWGRGRLAGMSQTDEIPAAVLAVVAGRARAHCADRSRRDRRVRRLALPAGAGGRAPTLDARVRITSPMRRGRWRSSSRWTRSTSARATSRTCGSGRG